MTEGDRKKTFEENPGMVKQELFELPGVSRVEVRSLEHCGTGGVVKFAGWGGDRADIARVFFKTLLSYYKTAGRDTCVYHRDGENCGAYGYRFDHEFVARKIYVASSWRNPHQPSVVNALRHAGHDVYDFRNPKDGDHGFHWSEIDKDWQGWSMEDFREGLNHPLAKEGFRSDLDAMKWADTCVMVMPCGRSAHLEAGYFVGAGKKLLVLLADGEPELMYKMADHILTNIDEVVRTLGGADCRVRAQQA